MRSVALNRHVLPFALALIAGALFAPSPVHGVTLGNVASLSALGHPLRIVIPVALSTGETLNIACVKLVADNNAAGAPQIVTGRVNLEQAANGLRLQITSPVSVSEPALRLAVQVGCGSTTRRDYVLFLDPPANESPSAIAAADTEDPASARVTREHVAVAAAKPHHSVVAAAPSPLPPTTWGTPVPTSPTIDEARPKAPDRTAPEPKVEVPVIAAAATAPREPTVVSSSGGFISEAGASPLPLRPPVTKATSSQSYALSGHGQGAWRAQPQPTAASIWQVMWPYASVIFGTMGLGLLALILHRRRVIKPSWMDPNTRTTLGAETQAGAPQATVAHFGAMTESGKASRRASLKLPDIERAAEVSELDTLLQDIQADMIDERSVKEAWKSAAGDSPLDMGTDSILKAIAAAEHSLQIGAPEPSQVALDRALDKDLMTVPNAPKGVRFG